MDRYAHVGQREREAAAGCPVPRCKRMQAVPKRANLGPSRLSLLVEGQAECGLDDGTRLENGRAMSLEGSSPSPSVQGISSTSLQKQDGGESSRKGTEGTRKNPKGTVRMQAGCKQDASELVPDGAPAVL